ncbi:hypothetical protein C2I36_15300, partial [Rhodobacteraceae bacterium WD3A24]
MGTLIAAVLWVLAALVAAAVLAVATPVMIGLDAAAEPRRLRLRLGLFGGVVPFFPLWDSSRPRRRAAADQTPANAGRKPAR